jgi:uncharacterized membrane protein YcaP (DUF421 family)
MDIVIRALVVFVLLWVVIRVTGKREVAQLSAFDTILLGTLGDLVAQGVVQEDYSLTADILAVSTFSVASLFLAGLDFRFRAVRPVLAGQPRIVVRDGEQLLEILDGERLTIEDLHEAAHTSGIRSLHDIELCVLEANGRFSFFTREGASS